MMGPASSSLTSALIGAGAPQGPAAPQGQAVDPAATLVANGFSPQVGSWRIEQYRQDNAPKKGKKKGKKKQRVTLSEDGASYEVQEWYEPALETATSTTGIGIAVGALALIGIGYYLWTRD